jgi:hypothetical protein
MIELLLLPLVCFGVCKIIIEGSIFEETRSYLAGLEYKFENKFFKWLSFKSNQLINCYLCLGFQFGWIMGLFNGPFPAWNVLYNGAFYAATTWIIYCIVQYLGNGNDPNRSIILQVPDTIKIEKTDIDILHRKDINKD